MTKPLALAGLLAATVLPAATPSYAASRSEYAGGCGFLTVAETSVPEEEHYGGVMWVAAVVYSAANPTDNPVSATITCELRVNGVPRITSGPYAGAGLIVGAEDIQFVIGNADVVDMCETVDFTSDDTPTVVDCGADPPEPIGQPVVDLVNAVVEHVVDRKVCPVFAELFPPEGDIPYPVDGSTFWDCPPYGN